MSLITEALGLRRSKSSAVGAQETLPPFRTRNLSMQVVSLMVMIAGLTVVAVWQGPVILAWLEQLAGVGERPVAAKTKPSPAQTTETAPSPSAEAGPAKPEEKKISPIPATPPAGVAPAREKTAAVAAPASLLGVGKTESSGDEVFQAVEIPFTPMVRDEDPARAAEKKKEELAAAVRSFQIQGVRLQGRDSRVLINGNPVSPGESVGDAGLKLKTVEPSRLIFSDGVGNEYPKSY